jgi:hypothetical protein
MQRNIFILTHILFLFIGAIFCPYSWQLIYLKNTRMIHEALVCHADHIYCSKYVHMNDAELNIFRRYLWKCCTSINWFSVFFFWKEGGGEVIGCIFSVLKNSAFR